jgi:hypothetical protein
MILEGPQGETAGRDRDRQGRPRPNRAVGCDTVCDWERPPSERPSGRPSGGGRQEVCDLGDVI